MSVSHEGKQARATDVSAPYFDSCTARASQLRTAFSSYFVDEPMPARNGRSCVALAP
jgi:hypothetical protein